jgi:hypothetical protein
MLGAGAVQRGDGVRDSRGPAPHEPKPAQPDSGPPGPTSSRRSVLRKFLLSLVPCLPGLQPSVQDSQCPSRSG